MVRLMDKLKMLCIVRDALVFSLNIASAILKLLKRVWNELNKLPIRIGIFAEYQAKTPTLTDPGLSTTLNVSDDIYELAAHYYDDGVVVLHDQSFKREMPDLLADLKKEFCPMVKYFDQAPNVYSRNFFWDSRGRRWFLNKPKGVLQLSVPYSVNNTYNARLHPMYSEQLDLYNTDSLKRDFPVFEKILGDELLRKFVSYANKTNQLPSHIVIERRIHASIADRDDFLPHVDMSEGVFKSFIYLNDVGRLNGPIHVSKGSHHWGLYPRLLKDIYLGQTKHASILKTDIGSKWGINLFEPIVGSAGDQVLVSTNALHHASSPMKNLER